MNVNFVFVRSMPEGCVMFAIGSLCMLDVYVLPIGKDFSSKFVFCIAFKKPQKRGLSMKSVSSI